MASAKSRLADMYHSAEHFLADMPIAKAVGSVISNPTPQEVGAQISNLGSSASDTLQEATKDPMSAALNFAPMGMGTVGYHGTTAKIGEGFKFNPTSESKNLSEIWGNTSEIPVKRTGVFFSKSKKFASEFGPNVGKFDLNVKNTAKIDEDIVFQFSNSIDPFGPDRDLFLGVRQMARDIADKKDVNVWKLFDDETGAKFKDFLESKGYDSASLKESTPSKLGGQIKGSTIVVFDPNKIHIKAEDYLDK